MERNQEKYPERVEGVFFNNYSFSYEGGKGDISNYTTLKSFFQNLGSNGF